MDEETGSGQRRAEIIELLNGARPKRARRTQATSSFVVDGYGNVVAGRDVIHTGRVVVHDDTPLNGAEISESQVYALQRLMDEIVAVEAKVKRKPRTYAAVRGAFKTRFKLASYRRLPAARFDEAVSYLRQTLGRLSAGRSAPAKLGPAWRKRQYAYIKINTQGLEDWLADYLQRKFDATSIADLSDADLKQTYSAVASKKRGRR